MSEMVKALKKTDVCMQKVHKGDWNSLKESAELERSGL